MVPIGSPHLTLAAFSKEDLSFPSDRSVDVAEGDKKRTCGNSALDTVQVNLGIRQASESIVTS